MSKPTLVSLLTPALLALGAGLPPASAPAAAIAHAPVTLAASAFGHRGGPTRLVVSGGLVLPSGLTAARACHGAMSVRVLRGRSTLATVRTVLNGGCTYRGSVVLTSARLRGVRALRLVARYGGNGAVAPALSRALFVSLP